MDRDIQRNTVDDNASFCMYEIIWHENAKKRVLKKDRREQIFKKITCISSGLAIFIKPKC